MKERRPIAQVTQGRGRVRVAGRVLGTSYGEFRLGDESGEIVVRGDARAGDIVEVVGSVREGFIEASAITLLTPYQGLARFPDPRSETWRLGPGRRQRLRERARVLAAVRGFFAERGYLEVETPVRVPSPGLEVHLSAEPSGRRWLITSPEYQMKRLLSAGCEKIYQISRCFRRGEGGPYHSPEFTMLEWYRAYSDGQALARETEELGASVAMAVNGTTVVERGDQRLDLEPPWERLTVAEALERYAGLEIPGDLPVDELRRRVVDAGYGPVADDSPWDDLFFQVFVTAVEPRLGRDGKPTILTEWPAPLAALARLKPGDPTVALRFEVFAAGFELANAFDELTDPAEQERRLLDDLREREARGLDCYPVDERFLGALAEGLPPCAGIALGIDRLAMLVTGATEIREVLTFADDEL